MTFNIVLQRRESEKNIFDLNTITVNGVLKTSIANPVFVIACDLYDVISCNYLTMSYDTFSQSYFVKDIKSIGNGLVEFYCHADTGMGWF